MVRTLAEPNLTALSGQEAFPEGVETTMEGDVVIALVAAPKVVETSEEEGETSGGGETKGAAAASKSAS